MKRFLLNRYEIIVPPKFKHYLHIYENVDIIRAHECVFVFGLWTGVCNGLQSIEGAVKTTAVHYKETEFGFPQEQKVIVSGLVSPCELCVSLFRSSSIDFGKLLLNF